MPKTYVRYTFDTGSNLYESDINGVNVNLSSGTYVPDILASRDLAFWDGLATLIGGRITKFLPGGRNERIPSICKAGTDVIARKIKLIFEGGSSFNVPIRVAEGIHTVTQSVVTYVNDQLAGAAGSEIICVSLEGEVIKNANNIFNLSWNGSDTAPSGNGSRYYAGVISYGSDRGANVDVPVKILSNDPTAPPPILSQAQWDGCVGTFKNVSVVCPGTGGRGSRALKHRHFIIRTATEVNSEPAQEDREVPVNITSTKRADVLACGNVLAAITGAVCLSYKGENDDSFGVPLDLTAVTP